MDVVIVPVWRRAGFATACLRRLAEAADDNVRVLVSVDCNPDPDTLNVARDFVNHDTSTRAVAIRDQEYPTGSYNVFTAMAEVLTQVGTNDLVHVLEEDILVSREYFEYHRSAHEVVGDQAYMVSACENVFLSDDAASRPEADAVYRSGAFQVWGSSYRPERVESVLRRLRPIYFDDMHAAVTAEFGEANALRTGPLYDGVMANDLALSGQAGVFPFVPRAYHAGFEGVSYGNKALTGTPDQQADQIIRMTGAELRARCMLQGARFRPIDLDEKLGPITRVVAW